MAKTVASASQIASNWSSAMASPQTSQKYTAGINRVTQSPTAAAATPQAEAAYLAGIQNAINSGKRANALNAVSLQSWKQAATTMGASGLARGAQKGTPKYTAAVQKWQPIYQQASDAASQIPKDGSLASAQARWLASTQVLMAAAGKQ